MTRNIIKHIRMVIACHNCSGEPDFAFMIVECSEDQRNLGEHYNIAEEWALENRYEKPFITWDEVECPDWLFERFVWESASTVKSCGCVTNPE